MQTRKRAKSVSFGKKPKDKKEEDIVEKTPVAKEVEEKDTKPDEKTDKKTVDKHEVVERRPIVDKPQNEDLLTDLPDAKKEHESKVAETAKSDFVTDSDAPVASDTSELSATPPDSKDTATDTSESDTTAQPIVTPSPETGTQASSSQQPNTEDLSSTLPPSAFTIQNNESEIPQEQEVEKKKFGVYFFVVAFLSFILGLSAMAAVSYFGLISLSFPKLQLGAPIHIGSFLGAKPTLTPTPSPTSTPTPVPVNLKQFTIEVLNGSGITGQAAKAESSLNGDGYSVSSTGNAPNSNFTKTEIAAKKSVSTEYLTKLEAELGKTYVVNTTVTTVSDSNTTDVIVTLGSQTAQ